MSKDNQFKRYPCKFCQTGIIYGLAVNKDNPDKSTEICSNPLCELNKRGNYDSEVLNS